MNDLDPILFKLTNCVGIQILVCRRPGVHPPISLTVSFFYEADILVPPPGLEPGTIR